jgi:hypothetical protein
MDRQIKKLSWSNGEAKQVNVLGNASIEEIPNEPTVYRR